MTIVFIIVAILIVLGIIGNAIEQFNRARMGTNINNIRKSLENGGQQEVSQKQIKNSTVNREDQKVLETLKIDSEFMNTDVEYTDYDNFNTINFNLPLEDLNEGLNEFSKRTTKVKNLLFNNQGQIYLYALPMIKEIAGNLKVNHDYKINKDDIVKLIQESMSNFAREAFNKTRSWISKLKTKIQNSKLNFKIENWKPKFNFKIENQNSNSKLKTKNEIARAYMCVLKYKHISD